MPETLNEPDWNPLTDEAQCDQIAAYDRMRARCPVAWSEALGWSVFRHADVLRVLGDHETFGNRVSAHLSVPNGMDPPEHSRYRALIEPFFDEAGMAAFEPRCREIAEDCVAALPRGEPVEVVAALGEPFALRIQCAFMGWPARLHGPLQDWLRRNHAATRSGDRAATTAVALEFDGYIRDILAERRGARAAATDDAEHGVPDKLAGHDHADDVTDRLLALRIDGQPIDDAALVSIVRNWTVGELGTIAASVGILVHHLARDARLQARLRDDRSLVPVAIDEILRLDAPLIANRRVARRKVELGGKCIEAGERLSLLWASANRDERLFGDPDRIVLDRDPSLNLLYGAGIHVCPGAPLARLELRLLVLALLGAAESILPAPGKASARAVYPAGGYRRVSVVLA